MKKLIGPFAKVGGALFALGVFVIIVSLSYSALGRIFPGRLFDQSAGLLLFDAAAIVWFLAFIGNCTSTSQYVFSGIGFLLGVAGSLGLIGIEVGISSSLLAAADMLKPLNYVFVGAAVGHLLLLYAFHGSAPEISAKISLGVEKARVHDEGMRQAEQSIRQTMGELGEVISVRLVEEVLRDLNMRPRQIVDSRLLPADDSLHVPSNGYPTQGPTTSFLSNPREWLKQKLTRRQTPAQTYAADSLVGQGIEREIVWMEPEKLNGQRVRLYCLHCFREGKPWMTQEPCSHVLNAIGAPIKPLSTGYAMDVASVSIQGAAAGANTVTEPASNQPTESAEQSEPLKGAE